MTRDEIMAMTLDELDKAIIKVNGWWRQTSASTGLEYLTDGTGRFYVILIGLPALMQSGNWKKPYQMINGANLQNALIG